MPGWASLTFHSGGGEAIAVRPLVSAVVVNWNGAEHLEAGLPSLVGQTYSNLKILVVDNGSVDASEKVVTKFGAGWLPLARNFGLAAAMNEGARAMPGEFLLFLNNDMRFAPDFVGRLVAALESDDAAFAADAQQLDWNGREAVHQRTRLVRKPWRWETLLGWEIDQVPATNITPCLFASAANILVRRSMFEELGGWDDRFTAGSDDLDLCWRAWARGWKCLYVPEAICWHRVGASSSSREGVPARLWGSLYGRLRFSLKNLPLRKAALLIAITLARVPFDLTKGRTAIAGTRIKAVVSLVQEASEIRQARKAIRRTSGRSLQSLLERLALVTQTEQGENQSNDT